MVAESAQVGARKGRLILEFGYAVSQAPFDIMRKRRLQIFLSSTYEDLIDERLAAIETILAAGHIPAAMEQFSPGDETAWERITAWIDESDGFILILGGRYGSIEPTSGKSYVQLEYEYALDKKKPLFALVVSKEHHEERVKGFGLKVDERERPQEYSRFKSVVAQKLCGFWNDKKDIKIAIFQKLPEWAQRSDLTGWVRGDEATSPEVMNELAKLSRENRELRTQLKSNPESFDGLKLDESTLLLAERKLSGDDLRSMPAGVRAESGAPQAPSNLLEFLELSFDAMAAGIDWYARSNPVLDAMVGFGLLVKDPRVVNTSSGPRQVFRYTITETARRLRNWLVSGTRTGTGSGTSREGTDQGH